MIPINPVDKGTTSYPPVPPLSGEDSKTSRAGKRRFDDSDDAFSSTCSSPTPSCLSPFSTVSSPIPFPDSGASSPSKKGKEKHKTGVRWVDDPEFGNSSPVSGNIASSYSIDTEEFSSNSSKCTSVKVSDLWHDHSLYGNNNLINRPLDEESNHGNEISCLKKSAKSGLLTQVKPDATDKLAELLTSLTVVEYDESLTF